MNDEIFDATINLSDPDFAEKLESALNQPHTTTHPRFDRNVLAFKSNFTGALAKWLVEQSPYIVPDNLTVCLEKFDAEIEKHISFDSVGMAEVSLKTITSKINKILESIPEIMALNERKNGRDGNAFCSRYDSGQEDPDDGFIDIMAVAQNITCEFADKADLEAYLDKE